MKKRSPIFVFLIGFITIFIYSWYWLVKTKGEMNKMGQKVPTAFLWLIPIVGTIWWMWKYAEAVENVTNKELGKVLAFVVLYLLGPIGHAIVQDYFNKVEAAPAGADSVVSAAQPAEAPIDQQPTTTPIVQPVSQPSPAGQTITPSEAPQPAAQIPTPQVITPTSTQPNVGGNINNLPKPPVVQ